VAHPQLDSNLGGSRGIHDQGQKLIKISWMVVNDVLEFNARGLLNEVVPKKSPLIVRMSCDFVKRVLVAGDIKIVENEGLEALECWLNILVNDFEINESARTLRLELD
jgi:hypothetical protein